MTNDNTTANTSSSDGNVSKSTEEDTAKAAEQVFWKTFEEKLDGRLNDFFNKKKKELTALSSSRSGEGRPTLPGVLANIMWGPNSKKD